MTTCLPLILNLTTKVTVNSNLKHLMAKKQTQKNKSNYENNVFPIIYKLKVFVMISNEIGNFKSILI